MATRQTNGTAIKALRDAYGITQQALAARTGISPAYLSNLEAGRKQPAPAVARRIADELGVPLDAITYPVPDIEAVAS